MNSSGKRVLKYCGGNFDLALFSLTEDFFKIRSLIYPYFPFNMSTFCALLEENSADPQIRHIFSPDLLQALLLCLSRAGHLVCVQGMQQSENSFCACGWCGRLFGKYLQCISFLHPPWGTPTSASLTLGLAVWPDLVNGTRSNIPKHEPRQKDHG